MKGTLIIFLLPLTRNLGTSIARELFEDEHGQTLNVVMLEARQTCTGATGR
jgi:hypothetical protein